MPFNFTAFAQTMGEASNAIQKAKDRNRQMYLENLEVEDMQLRHALQKLQEQRAESQLQLDRDREERLKRAEAFTEKTQSPEYQAKVNKAIDEAAQQISTEKYERLIKQFPNLSEEQKQSYALQIEYGVKSALYRKIDTKTVLDPNSKTGYSSVTMALDETGKPFELFRMPNIPAPSSSMETVSTTSINPNTLQSTRVTKKVPASNVQAQQKTRIGTTGGVPKETALDALEQQISEGKQAVPTGAVGNYVRADMAKKKLQIPTKMPTAAETQVRAAVSTIQQVQNVRNIIKASPNIIGPAVGRIENMGFSAGANPFAKSEDERKAAQLAGHLVYLFANELRASFPGRTNQQMQQLMKERSAQIYQNDPTLSGFLDSAETNARIAIKSVGDMRYTLSPEVRNMATQNMPTGKVRVRTGQGVHEMTMEQYNEGKKQFPSWTIVQ